MFAILFEKKNAEYAGYRCHAGGCSTPALPPEFTGGGSHDLRSRRSRPRAHGNSELAFCGRQDRRY